jgi:hypothetical protein
VKYKKDLAGLFVLLGFTWQVFDSIRSSYTPTQAILVVIFGYIGVRLTYFVYFKIINIDLNSNKQFNIKQLKNETNYH